MTGPLVGEVILPPLAVTARPVHKHAVCGYAWHRAMTSHVRPYTTQALCGDRVDLPQPPNATIHCPQCTHLARTHGQACDCFKKWPRTTVPGTTAPRSLP